MSPKSSIITAAGTATAIGTAIITAFRAAIAGRFAGIIIVTRANDHDPISIPE